MNRFALVSFWRSLTHHRLYAALNIGGLAVGIAVFLVLALYGRFETSFERWLPRHDQVYLVQSDWHWKDSPMSGTYQTTMGGLLPEMKQEFPSLVGTRFHGGEDGGSVLRDGRATTEDIGRVDADFFKVFDLPMVAGDKATALVDPTSIVLSQSAAKKYFGEANPIGKTITIAFEKPAVYRVTGIFADLPTNTDFKFSILARQSDVGVQDYWFHWGSASLYTFVRFATAADARAFEARMPGFITRRATTDMGKNPVSQISLPLLPLTEMHLTPEGKASAAKKLTIVTLGIVGVLTLLIAIVNYVNLATARAGLRAREVAMRKVLGASQSTLVRHFLGEAVATVGIAAIVGLALAELALPIVNAAGGTTLSIPYLLVIPGLAAVAVVVGVLAGFYPALLLSRWPASQVLQSARAPGGGRSGTRVREALVVLQFALAVAFIVGTMVLVAQTRHMRAIDLGFRRDGLLVLVNMSDDSLDRARRLTILRELKALPGVTGVTNANTAVAYNGNNNFNNVDVPGRPKPGPSLRQINVARDFFTTYGAHLVAGRWFDDAHRSDDSTGRKKNGPRNIVLNRLGVAKLGYASPERAVGRTVWANGPATIIGVVDQLRFYTPRLPDDPTYYAYSGDLVGSPIVTVR